MRDTKIDVAELPACLRTLSGYPDKTVERIALGAASALEAAQAEVERLSERLESNHVFNMRGEREDVDPGSIPDGIDCRDETIRQAHENRDRLLARAEASEAREARMREALEPFAAKWDSLRDPLPQGPFSVTVPAMDCCQAYRTLKALQEGE